MKNIIIMLGAYWPKPLANGICANKIAIGLKNKGYNIDIIGFDIEKGGKKEYIKDDIIHHYIKPRKFFLLRSWGEKYSNKPIGRLVYKFSILLNRVKKIIYFPFYPMSSIGFIFRYYIAAKKILKNKKIDAIISVYNPFEGLVAGLMIKRKYPQIKFCAYVLDTLTNEQRNKTIKNKIKSSKGQKWENKIYKKSDLILNMKCHEEHHKDNKYNKYRNKMQIVDIPLFDYSNNINVNIKDNYYNNDCINWCYTGALELESRNPRYICNIIKDISIKSKIHFFSRGNCENLLKKYEQETDGIIVRHGYVPKEEVDKALKSADIIVSIEAEGTDMIPSKIFEYMSSGKKIIHFYKNASDICIRYYKDYNKALLINENEDKQTNIKKIIDFIKKENENMELDNLKQIFIMNTPEFTVDKIINMINN